MTASAPSRRRCAARHPSRHRHRRLHRGDQAAARFYGVGGAPISAQDGATVRLDPSGAVPVPPASPSRARAPRPCSRRSSPTRRRADRERARHHRRHRRTPYGGGTWASRGAGIGGEAACRPGGRCATTCSPPPPSCCKPPERSISAPAWSSKPTPPRAPASRMSRARRLFPPRHAAARLPGRVLVTRHYAARLSVCLHQRRAGVLSRGRYRDRIRPPAQALVVEDCGPVINPLLVDEQIRGGVVQGIGGALYEHCLYDEGPVAQWQHSTTSCRWPARCRTSDRPCGNADADSQLGAKGVGEAGTAGAPAA